MEGNLKMFFSPGLGFLQYPQPDVPNTHLHTHTQPSCPQQLKLYQILGPHPDVLNQKAWGWALEIP